MGDVNVSGDVEPIPNAVLEAVLDVCSWASVRAHGHTSRCANGHENMLLFVVGNLSGAQSRRLRVLGFVRSGYRRTYQQAEWDYATNRRLRASWWRGFQVHEWRVCCECDPGF